MTSQPGKQIIAIQIFPNISRSKGNQKMKFGQLTKCNTRNNFLEKLFTKCGEDVVGTSCLKDESGAVKVSVDD